MLEHIIQCLQCKIDQLSVSTTFNIFESMKNQDRKTMVITSDLTEINCHTLIS